MLLTCYSNQPFANSFGCRHHLIMPSQFPLSQATLQLATTPQQPGHNAGQVAAGEDAFRRDFVHPMTGEFLKFEAEPEPRFMEWYRKLRETR